MAINKNHEFEELEGVKCGIVEKNVTPIRVEFLKQLLTFNGFTVLIAPTPAPKVVAKPIAKTADGEELPTPPPPPLEPETFSVGVTDYTFNSINAIFGRLLKTPEGHVVTLAYWQQQETSSQDEIPYYEHK